MHEESAVGRPEEGGGGSKRGKEIKSNQIKWTIVVDAQMVCK